MQQGLSVSTVGLIIGTRIKQVDVVLQYVAWLAVGCRRRSIDGRDAEEAVVTESKVRLLVLDVGHDRIWYLTVLLAMMLLLSPVGRHRLRTLHASAWLSSGSCLLLQISDILQVDVENSLLTACAHLSSVYGLDDL